MADLALQLQADNLPSEKLEELLVEGPWKPILGRLMTGENLLLEGCRGVGKTMLMRAANNRLASSVLSGGRVLGVHTTFKRYLATIPAPDSQDSAELGAFRAWVNARILGALKSQIQKIYENRTHDSLRELNRIKWNEVVSTLETTYRTHNSSALTKQLGQGGLSSAQYHALQGYTYTVDILQAARKAFGLDLIVLFLDDAAHALDIRAQSVFFTNIKSLYGEGLAFKISVYPAVTRYGIDFSYGHDAVVVSLGEVPKPSNLTYFSDLLKKRLAIVDQGQSGATEELIKILLAEHDDWVRLMVYCSNANPRALLKLVGQVLTELGTRSPNQVKYEDIRNAVNNVMDRHLDQMVPGVIKDLDPRLLRASELLLEDFRDKIRSNPGPFQGTQPRMFLSVTNSMQIPYICTAAVKLLVAAQVLSPVSSARLSKRENGTTYLLHPGFVFRDNVVTEGGAFASAERWLQHFNAMSPRFHAEISKSSDLWGEIKDAANEEPSRRCISGHPMLEGLTSCEECGSRVAVRAPAEILLNKDIAVLELSDALKQRLRSAGYSTIRTVFEASKEELDQIPYVGEIRVIEIRSAVEAAVDEYMAG